MTILATPGIPNRRSHDLFENVCLWFGGPRLFRFLGLVGVPFSVLMLTGGVSTLGFWISSVLVLGLAFTFGAMPGALLLLLPTVLLSACLSKILPRWKQQISSVVGVAPWFLSGGFVFLTQEILIAEGVRLPTDSAQLGVLIVGAAAGLASWSLLTWSAQLDEANHRSARQRPATRAIPAHYPGEPPNEFWSPEPIAAWRMWRWDGSTLRGMFVAWERSDLVAECVTCVEPPGWGHVCGIYAVPSANDLYSWRFHWDGPIVVGRVELAGLVIEHEDGFRASHARIVELQVASPEVAQALKHKYPDVDVHVWTSEVTSF